MLGIPDHDGLRSRREPVFNIPSAVLFFIAACTAIQALTEALGPDWNVWLVDTFAFVPGRLTNLFDPDGLRLSIAALAAQGPDGSQEADIARFFLGNGELRPWGVLTYALLHGGWMHLAVNSIWLLAFGSAVARRFGSVRFLALMAFCALAGAAAHYAAHPYGLMPVVGASAAVSGAMGAAIRFAFQPGAPLGGGGIAPGSFAYMMPAVPLGRVLANSRAMGFVLVWFAVNILFGLGATAFGLSDAPIAWEAHIGGFLGGLLAFSLFDPMPSRM